MFKVCHHQLMRSFLSPRFYVALLIGIVVHSLNITPLITYAESISEPVCILDGFVLFNTDIFSLAASSLGVILLVSDIPFTTQNETYTLLRITRIEWAAGKILYLLCSCTIYYLVVFSFGAILLAGNAYYSNIWSQPLYLLATDSSGALQSQVGLSFPGYIITAFQPFQAFIICFMYSIAYAFVLSLVTFWFNLKCSSATGYFLSVMFHVINYFMTKIFPTKAFWKYSILANSSLGYHRYEVYANSHNLLTIEQSWYMFIIIELALFALIHFAVKKYDFRITVGTNQ